MLTTSMIRLTCAEQFSSPEDRPSDIGYVISAANSNPMGKIAVAKNLQH